jgi:hypothetical protein
MVNVGPFHPGPPGSVLSTNLDAVILESFRECPLDRALMLFLNDARSGGKDPEGPFSHARVG